MSDYSNIRHPFLPLPYTDKDKIIPGELMIDYDKGNMYTKSDDSILPLGLNEINSKVNYMVDSLTDNGKFTLNMIRTGIKNIEDWIESLEKLNTSDNVDNLNKLFGMFNGINVSGNTIKTLLDSKLKNSEGILSSNDFTDTLKFKLENIEPEANKYVHPKEMQCTINNGANSLNFKIGNVILNKADIGLGNVDILANKYIHPEEVSCNVNAVHSANGKVGNVYLDKNDIELDNIMNYDIASDIDINNMVDNKYLTPYSFHKILELLPLFSCSRAFAGYNMYGGLKIDGKFFIKSGDLYKDELILTDVLDIVMGQFIVILKTDGTVKQCRVKDNKLIEYDNPIIPKDTDFIQIGNCKGYMGAAIRSDGTHVRWGLDDITRVVQPLPDIDPYDNPVQIVGHSTYLVYLFDSGRVGVYGKSTGVGDRADYVPSVPYDQNFIGISAGFDFISCIKTDGRLATYGRNSFENGQIKDYVPEGNDYVQVCSGDRHSIALKQNGVIVGWGSNNKNIYDVPGGKFISIDCFGDTNIAVSETGLIYLWGEDAL